MSNTFVQNAATEVKYNNQTEYEACRPKSIRLYFFPEKPVTAGWQI
jgi:hypothetical protein